MNLHGFMEEVGFRVRAERLARRWSVVELAELAQVGAASIKRLENGTNCFLDTYIYISTAFQLPAYYLMSPDWVTPKTRVTLTPRQIRVLHALSEGGSLAEVGARLGFSDHAVASDLSRIYVRLDIPARAFSNRREAAIQKARKHQLIPWGDDDKTDG